MKLARRNGLRGSTWTTNGTVWAVNRPEEALTVIHDIDSVKLFNERHARPDDAVPVERMDDGIPEMHCEQRCIGENRLVRQPRRFMVAGGEPQQGSHSM